MPLSSHIKPEANPPLTRERVIRIREMYAEGFAVARILTQCQISLRTFYACLDGCPFGANGEQWPALPRRRMLKADSVSLVNRLTRTAERQVRDIELRLSAGALSPADCERDVRMLASLARTLASLARTLRDLRMLNKALPAKRDFAPGNDDERPADIDALRRELSHKLHAMAAGAAPAHRPEGNAWDPSGSD